jgi:hypothetical protein
MSSVSQIKYAARTKLEEAAALLAQLPYDEQAGGVSYLEKLLRRALERTRLRSRAKPQLPEPSLRKSMTVLELLDTFIY